MHVRVNPGPLAPAVADAPTEREIAEHNERMRIFRLSPYKLEYLAKYLGPKALQWYQFGKPMISDEYMHYDYVKAFLKNDLSVIKAAPLRPLNYKICDNIVMFIPNISEFEIIREVKETIPSEIRQYLLPDRDLSDMAENLKLAYDQYIDRITNQVMVTQTDGECKPPAPSVTTASVDGENFNCSVSKPQIKNGNEAELNQIEAQSVQTTLIQNPFPTKIPGYVAYEPENLMLQVSPGNFRMDFRNSNRSNYRGGYQRNWRGSNQ